MLTIRFFVLIAALILIRSAHAVVDETVNVTITATLPKDTPADAKIYLAGNLDEVGKWKADGVAMKKLDAGEYQFELKLPKGQTLEYKINRGSWETVEKGTNGEELANRTLALDADKVEKITVARWADAGAATRPTTRASTATGDIRYHEHFTSRNLGNERRLIVWLPPDYAKHASQRYPVLYLHDGQNIFDDATSFAGEWRADETAAKLIDQGKIPPLILVGVENAGAARVDEYTPTRDT